MTEGGIKSCAGSGVERSVVISCPLVSAGTHYMHQCGWQLSASSVCVCAAGSFVLASDSLPGSLSSILGCNSQAAFKKK